jgi:acylphosphatase
MSSSGATDLTAVRAVIRGRVQGVSFRWYTREEAERLGVAGWVRNRPDGSVELWAEGAREAVEALLAWCHRGPPAARVSGVETDWGQATEAQGFTIR